MPSAQGPTSCRTFAAAALPATAAQRQRERSVLMCEDSMSCRPAFSPSELTPCHVLIYHGASCPCASLPAVPAGFLNRQLQKQFLNGTSPAPPPTPHRRIRLAVCIPTGRYRAVVGYLTSFRLVPRPGSSTAACNRGTRLPYDVVPITAQRADDRHSLFGAEGHHTEPPTG